MRLKNLLCVIAYRLPYRETDPNIVSLFTETLYQIVRNTSIKIGTDPFKWKFIIHAATDSGVPLHIEEQAWKTTKGGFGARDIWDTLIACDNATRKYQTKEEKDEKMFNMFLLTTLMKPMSKYLLGGNYGDSVRKSLRMAMAIHLPETLHLKNFKKKTIFTHFLKFIERIELNVQTSLENYLKCLQMSLRLSEENIHKGVLSHYSTWAKKSYKASTNTNIVKILMQDMQMLKKYLQFCEKQKCFCIHYQNKDIKIPLNYKLKSEKTHYKMDRVVQECTSFIKESEFNEDDIFKTTFLEAEFNWEHNFV